MDRCFLFRHVCYFCGYGRGLAGACACEDQLGGLGVFLWEGSWQSFRIERRESNLIGTAD